MSQSLGFSWHSFFNKLLRILFILSQSPLHFGLYRVVNNCLSGTSLQTSFIRSEVNWLPLSLKFGWKTNPPECSIVAGPKFNSIHENMITYQNL